MRSMNGLPMIATPPAGRTPYTARAMAAGTLSIVATPIGNPEDLTPRAARALREAEIIVAEDTRSARRLLAGIGGRPTGEPLLLSCYDANEGARAIEIADRLRAGARVALVSEAGTPLVSDPGYRVVVAAIAAGARVVPVPGAAAVLAALVGSGLPPDRFLFHGFPPRKSGARRRLFESLRALPATLVFYESPMRTGATLADLAAVLGPERPACVARELTKEHEELVRDTLGGLAARYATDRPLGEVTLVVGGASTDGSQLADEWDDESVAEEAVALVARGLSPRDAARELAALTGRARRDVYRIVVRATGAGGEPDASDGEE
jgi:16S rRNA (cytidine1402-2'-O)-methyltransferase